jgi:hypothetical protein
VNYTLTGARFTNNDANIGDQIQVCWTVTPAGGTYSVTVDYRGNGSRRVLAPTTYPTGGEQCMPWQVTSQDSPRMTFIITVTVGGGTQTRTIEQQVFPS